MNVYAETSAILSWLFDDPQSPSIASVLNIAQRVFASKLTLVECERVLSRSRFTRALSEVHASTCRSQLNSASAHWTLIQIDDEVLDRARRPFPAEPLRTLDAIHVASALLARRADPEVTLLSLDRRVRRCGALLGFPVHPAQM
ncbi:MAG TPA: type II toxin-antitoxin system VapC family toxin [Candidatus Binataceae bacterium]|nr:type II toxin-antitoxin system VapC family toxin [Candidatus Binataceae bacterium]